MIYFIGATARRARSRTFVLLAGVMTVITTATLLGSTVSSSEARIDGSLTAAFRPAYDILVRPSADVSEYERASGLVRDNFLSSLFGGISERQLAKVRRVPGVEAAPIENIGYVLVSQTVLFPWHAPTSGPSHQLYRLTARFQLPGGLVSWGSAYVYVSRSDHFTNEGPGIVHELLPRPSGSSDRAGRAERAEVCGPQSTPPAALGEEASPFTLGKLDGFITCYSEVTPASGSFPGAAVRIPISFDFPMLLSAVDPRVEASWFGLRRAMTSGRYLNEDAPGSFVKGTSLGTVERIPVVASSRTFLEESLRLTTALVAATNSASLPRRLASRGATAFAAGLRPLRETRVTDAAASVYAGFLRSARHHGAGATLLPVPQYWVTGQPHYAAAGRDAVTVPPVWNGSSIWQATPGWGNTEGISQSGEISYLPAPPGSDGTGYESLAVHDLRSASTGGPPVVTLDVVGEFDPSKIPGYPATSRVPLETFRPPVAVAADAATAKAIGGRTLGPTTNLAGYVAQPPLLLTTLAAAHSFFSDDRYENSSAARPISAILVRLTGSLGTGAASRARIEAAAVAIRTSTGLRVDIMDGSSPTPVRVALTGLSRSSPLELREGWTKKGVTYDIIGDLDLKTVGLLATAALAGVLFVAGAVAAAVRSRRRELAILLGLGWQRRDLLAAVLGEVLLVAAAGAAAGVAVTLVLARTLSLHLEPRLGVVVLVAAISPVAALLAALAPVWLGTRHEVVLSLSRVARRGGRRAGRAGLALATVTAAPGRALLAGVSLALGLTAFSTLLSLQRSFARHLVATRTVLGATLDLHVRALDVASAAAVLALGAAAVVNNTLSGSDERLRAHAVLAATGWEQRDLLVLVLVETLAVTAPAAALALAATAAICTALGAPPAATLGPCLVAAAASLPVVLTSVAVPIRRRLRQDLAHVLAAGAC
ncbi:MAG: FtsX-like permease family protein [Acidimicrobiales bacterium]